MTLIVSDYMGLLPHDFRAPDNLSDAAANWLRAQYPRDTAKHVARATGADVKTAENILAGHLSAASLTRLVRAYGWTFLAAVGAAAIGESYDQWIDRELEELADERRRLDEMEASLRSRWARVRVRRSLDGGALRLVPPEDDAPSWAPGNGPRGLGPETPRRKG